MRISAVVPSFNQAAFIGLTLESLLGQGDPDLEIIVVDGGSTDGSVDIIRRYADRLAWWVSESDKGQSHALNKGFARASGEWLCWLNSDDMLLAGALATVRANIGRAPATQWWIGGGFFIDSNGVRGRSYHPPRKLERAEQLGDWRTHWFAQPSTFFTRTLLDRAGGEFDENLHYAMDLDLWIRLLEKAPPGFIETELSAYRLHAEAKTTVLTPACESEIVRVVATRLGLEAALERVSAIAQDRMELEQKYQRLAKFARPLLGIFGPLKRIYQSVKKVPGPGGSDQ
jgi:glycosyltransferase involved in cell wall biosynthesis